MILFDGVALETIAPVRIEDIRVGPVELNPVSRPRAINAGSDFVRMRCGTRTVAITFGLQRENKITRQAALLAVSEWAKTDKEYRLELPLYADKYLQCVCTGKPEPSFRQWWEAKLRLTFTCFENPFWTSNEEKSAACGSAFYVLGNAAPLMKITRTLDAAATNQSYSNGSETITLSEIPAGDLTIDLNRQTIDVGGVSIMDKYAVASSFLIPKTGSQTITGTGSVKWHERWQ